MINLESRNIKQKGASPIMKSGKIAVLSVLALTASISAAMAAGTIVGTKHDLSTLNTAMYSGSPTSQVCVFCHTPHNARRNVPLWNRSDLSGGNTGFKFYTTSNTFADRSRVGATFNASSVSLYCMSCHDGATLLGGAVDHRPSGDWSSPAAFASTNTNVTADKIKTTASTALGKDLTNDHPVNFWINDGVAAKVNKNSFDKNTGWTLSAGNTLPLFKYSGSPNAYFECASCHAVHDNSHKYFLRTTNYGSKLCLACHEK